MEQRVEEMPFDLLSEEDHWLRSLATSGLVTLEGSHESVGKIIVPHDALWFRAVNASFWPSTPLHVVRTDTSNPNSRRQSDEPPLQPAEFLEALRQRQNRGRAAIVNVGSFAVPIALQHIAERVEGSHSIVGASDDDGDDDSEEVQEATWQRAAQFVLRGATAFWRSRKMTPPTPTLSAGPDGSVDVVWRHHHRSLYLNIPEEPETVVTFSGLDRHAPDSRFRGEEEIAGESDWMLGWLVR